MSSGILVHCQTSMTTNTLCILHTLDAFQRIAPLSRKYNLWNVQSSNTLFCMSTVALSLRRTFTTSSWPLKLAKISGVFPSWSGRKQQLSWMNGKNICELMTTRALQTPREPVSYLRKKYWINSKAVLSHSAPCSNPSQIVWWRTEIQSHIPQHFPL